MKKRFRNVVLAVVFSMVAALFAPASQTAQAATKTFTYAEQITGEKVTKLVMEKGESIDLKFIGVSNWKTYKYRWASSNTKVAVVDSAGLITAVGDGVATIKLMVSGGDGTQYTSTGVIIYVGQDQTVSIGTETEEEIKSYTIEMGKTVFLQANGLIGDVIDTRYTFEWSSTDTSVAKIGSNGLLTTVAPGLTVIQLKAVKKINGEVMHATPIAVLVTDKGAAVPTTKPEPTTLPGATAKPTAKPTATPKPTVTPVPTATTAPTVTPAPTAAATEVNYSVAVTSDRTLKITFNTKVDYTMEDIEFCQIIQAGTMDIPIHLQLDAVELDSTGKVMTVTTRNVLTTDRYSFKAGKNDPGKTFPITLGEPNRLQIVYTCLGKENTAYVYDEEVGLDVPVTLSYKLLYGDIDVTESYKNNGYVNFELTSPSYSSYVIKTGDQLYFYSDTVTADVKAVFTYYTESGKEKELKNNISIKPRSLGAYNVTGVVKWTIIDNDKATTIDWNNPVTSIIAGNNNYKIVALLADSYGYFYSTDARGADKENNIYSIDDSSTLFSMNGYSYSMEQSYNKNYFIDSNGLLYAFSADNGAVALVTLYNYDKWTSGQKQIGAWPFKILAESKLASIVPEETNITLVTQAVNNEDYFCTADVPVTLFDQYKNEWKDTANLEVSSSSSLLNSNISNAAYLLNNNGKWVLHIDGRAIKNAGISNTVTFYVTDLDSSRKSTGIRVTLKNPAVNGTINVGNWEIGMAESNVSYGKEGINDISIKTDLNIYQLSKNGSYKVGLLTNGAVDEYGNSINVKLQPTAAYTFSASNCIPGEVYVLVLGPDNKVVEEAASSQDLGVYLDPGTGRVSINVTTAAANIEALEPGNYTIRVTKINKVSGKVVSKITKTSAFMVEDKTANVTVMGYNNNRRTIETVSGVNDPKMNEIVTELFIFALDGTKWTGLTSDMVTKVNCTAQGANGAYRINSVEIALPAEDNVVTYSKTVKVNQIIYTGVSN